MNIKEEMQRIKNLMGIKEQESQNNFSRMGINTKSISRGGVMYQEQDQEEESEPVTTVSDLEINNNIQINKQKELHRQQQVSQKKIETDEIKKQEDEIERLGKEKKEIEQNTEEENKKKELDSRLERQRTQ